MLKQLIICTTIFNCAFSLENKYNPEREARHFAAVIEKAREEGSPKSLRSTDLDGLRDVFSKTSDYFYKVLLNSSGWSDFAVSQLEKFSYHPSPLRLVLSIYRLAFLLDCENKENVDYDGNQKSVFFNLLDRGWFPFIILTADGSIPPTLKNEFMSRKIILLGYPLKITPTPDSIVQEKSRYLFLLKQTRELTSFYEAVAS